MQETCNLSIGGMHSSQTQLANSVWSKTRTLLNPSCWWLVSVPRFMQATQLGAHPQISDLTLIPSFHPT